MKMQLPKLTFVFLVTFLFLPLMTFSSPKKTAVYFYADWCSHCQKVDAFLKEKGFYEKYDIQKKSMDEQQNKELLAKIFESKEKKEGTGIPAMIIDQEILLGDKDIISQFQQKIDSSSGETLDYIESVETGKPVVAKEKAKDVSFPLLFSAAISDAINPCAFAVLIILVGTILKSQGKKRALWAGLAFSAAIFISYFLMGLGLYEAISFFHISKYFSLLIGLLAILIGLANLKDAFWYKKFFVMEVPLSWRPKMQGILRSVTSPGGAFVAGILVSLFLLPCSSGPYIVIIGLLAERVDFSITLFKLLLYNLIFVLPMIAITVGVFLFNAKLGDLEKKRLENIRLLHGIVGVIMLLMGIYLIKGWV